MKIIENDIGIEHLKGQSHSISFSLKINTLHNISKVIISHSMTNHGIFQRIKNDNCLKSKIKNQKKIRTDNLHSILNFQNQNFCDLHKYRLQFLNIQYSNNCNDTNY